MNAATTHMTLVVLESRAKNGDEASRQALSLIADLKATIDELRKRAEKVDADYPSERQS